VRRTASGVLASDRLTMNGLREVFVELGRILAVNRRKLRRLHVGVEGALAGAVSRIANQ